MSNIIVDSLNEYEEDLSEDEKEATEHINKSFAVDSSFRLEDSNVSVVENEVTAIRKESIVDLIQMELDNLNRVAASLADVEPMKLDALRTIVTEKYGDLCLPYFKYADNSRGRGKAILPNDKAMPMGDTSKLDSHVEPTRPEAVAPDSWSKDNIKRYFEQSVVCAPFNYEPEAAYSCIPLDKVYPSRVKRAEWIGRAVTLSSKTGSRSLPGFKERLIRSTTRLHSGEELDAKCYVSIQMTAWLITQYFALYGPRDYLDAQVTIAEMHAMLTKLHLVCDKYDPDKKEIVGLRVAYPGKKYDTLFECKSRNTVLISPIFLIKKMRFLGEMLANMRKGEKKPMTRPLNMESVAENSYDAHKKVKEYIDSLDKELSRDDKLEGVAYE